MRKSPTFDPASPALVAAIAILAAPRWLGTASDLAALLPLHIRPSRPALLAIQIREAVGPLAALGVTLSMRREPKTGRRMITLARGDDGVVDAVCVPHVVSASYAPARARLEREGIDAHLRDDRLVRARAREAGAPAVYPMAHRWRCAGPWCLLCRLWQLSVVVAQRVLFLGLRGVPPNARCRAHDAAVGEHIGRG
jgi:hypothetical protein